MLMFMTIRPLCSSYAVVYVGYDRVVLGFGFTYKGCTDVTLDLIVCKIRE